MRSRDTRRTGGASLVRAALAAGAAAGTIAGAQGAASFPPSLELADLLPEQGGDGSVGFVLNGSNAYEASGISVRTAGDINGDGLADLVVGATFGAPNASGATYVVFGRGGRFPPVTELASLDGTNGFRIDGTAQNDGAGWSAAGTGDVNGDGVADLIIGAFGLKPGGRAYAGGAFVVFGRRTPFPGVIQLGGLNGGDGFRMEGVGAGDYAGYAVDGAGDVNGDGLADMVIGAPRADPTAPGAGSSYVVFGRRTAFPATIQLSALNGATGFRMDGAELGDLAGFGVAGGADVNGDGLSDLLIGAPQRARNRGAGYVVFGRRSGFPAVVALASLDGTTGFRMDGVADDDRAGHAVSITRDVNGDGVADMVLGAPNASDNGRLRNGAAFVVFGRRTPFPATFPLASLNGANGFRAGGATSGDGAGSFVGSAGDLDGDNTGDVGIGAITAPNRRLDASGAAFVVFGRTGSFPASLGLETLDGATGCRLNGVAAGDRAGSVADAGDLDGDGVTDLAVGAEYADPDGRTDAGQVYVVYGRRECRADFNLDGLVDSDDFFDFLNAFFAEDPSADFNLDGVIDSDDFFDFLNQFFDGC